MIRVFFLPFIIIFLVINLIIVALYYSNPAFELIPLLCGNVIWALLTLTSFLLIKKAINLDNPNAMLRAKLSGLILKFLISVGALMIYIFVNNREVHKPSLFLFLGMYIAYVVLETISLSHIAKNNNSNS